MTEYLFLAHDPGGCNTILPVYEAMCRQAGATCSLMLLGPAAQRDLEHAVPKENFMERLSSFLGRPGKKVLVTGTSWGDDSELTAIRRCRETGIPSVSILDYWCNYAERFRTEDGSFLWPDHYFVMDEFARAQAEKEGVAPAILRITGDPGLDRYIGAAVSHTNNGRAVFLSQPLSAIYGDSLGFTEFDATEDVILACEPMGIPVDVKFHAKDTLDYIKRFENRRVDGNMETLAAQYSLVIGMNTAGLLQCALLGARIISYQPRLRGMDMCITNQLGLTQGVYSYDELKKQIANADKPAHEWKNRPIWTDGKSTERCIDLLLRIGGVDVLS